MDLFSFLPNEKSKHYPWQEDKDQFAMQTYLYMNVSSEMTSCSRITFLHKDILNILKTSDHNKEDLGAI